MDGQTSLMGAAPTLPGSSPNISGVSPADLAALKDPKASANVPPADKAAILAAAQQTAAQQTAVQPPAEARPEMLKQGVGDIHQIEQQRQQQADQMAQQAQKSAPHMPTEDEMRLPPQQAQQFFPLMMLLSAIGGAKTATPMTAALQNMNGVLQAQVSGSKEMAEHHEKEMMSQYQAALDAHKEVLADLKPKIAALASGSPESLTEIRHELLLKGYRASEIDQLMNGDSYKNLITMYADQNKAHDANEKMLMTWMNAQMNRDQRKADSENKGQVYKLPDGTMQFITNEQAAQGLPEGTTLANAKGSSQTVAARQKLVQAGAANALNRLAEIKAKFPNETTSVLMSSHPEGLIESTIAGGIRSMQSKKQQDVDSDWRSFIDEAIPVFTGGLRGSDAFRRFIISQAPNMGAKNNAEIFRLFEENIKGTNRQFSDMAAAAYASDPKYWGKNDDGSPVTREQVQEAMASRGASSALAGVSPKSFVSESEAAAANLPKGTKVIINGVSGTWQ